MNAFWELFEVSWKIDCKGYDDINRGALGFRDRKENDVCN